MNLFLVRWLMRKHKKLAGHKTRAAETLKRLATSRNHIVPGHDPAVMKIYPAASDALKGLVVRLDVDPKV